MDGSNVLYCNFGDDGRHPACHPVSRPDGGPLDALRWVFDEPVEFEPRPRPAVVHRTLDGIRHDARSAEPLEWGFADAIWSHEPAGGIRLDGGDDTSADPRVDLDGLRLLEWLFQ